MDSRVMPTRNQVEGARSEPPSCHARRMCGGRTRIVRIEDDRIGQALGAGHERVLTALAVTQVQEGASLMTRSRGRRGRRFDG